MAMKDFDRLEEEDQVKKLMKSFEERQQDLAEQKAEIRNIKPNYTLQQLIECGVVDRIETQETVVGNGYKVHAKFHRAGFRADFDIDIDEDLVNIVLAINKLLELFEG